MNRAALAAVLFSLCSVAAWGQATAGRGAISGTVRDASGASVGGAKVVISNSSLGFTRELTTTDAGVFVAPALVPAGGYKVAASKQGFAPFESARTAGAESAP